ncbi:UNVERIFIED_CONTAM: hypothetical protein K2H54_057010 [Gekko kuhli]
MSSSSTPTTTGGGGAHHHDSYGSGNDPDNNGPSDAGDHGSCIDRTGNTVDDCWIRDPGDYCTSYHHKPPCAITVQLAWSVHTNTTTGPEPEAWGGEKTG